MYKYEVIVKTEKETLVLVETMDIKFANKVFKNLINTNKNKDYRKLEIFLYALKV